MSVHQKMLQESKTISHKLWEKIFTTGTFQWQRSIAMQIEKDKKLQKDEKDLNKHFREKEIPKMDGYIKGVQPYYYSKKLHSGMLFYVFPPGNVKD